MNFIDTHTHIYGEEFTADIDEVIERAKASGATQLLLPATDAASAHDALLLAQRFPGFCYPLAGLHPEEVKENYAAELEKVRALLFAANSPFVGVGEVGMDLYWDATFRAEQLTAFRLQAEWAHTLDLPLITHTRSAYPETLEVLEPWQKSSLKGIFHCFCGTKEEAERVLKFSNFYLGVGGLVTFKKSTLPQILTDVVPLNRLVLETDAPYMAPVPFRGKRNEPSFIPQVAQKLAEIYHTTPDEVGRITSENACKLFPCLRTTYTTDKA